MVFRDSTNNWKTYIIITCVIVQLTRNHINGDNPIQCQQSVKCKSPSTCCTTKSCEIASKRMCNVMDFDTDPCDNFYKFTCGGFDSNPTIYDISQDNQNTELYVLSILLGEQYSREKGLPAIDDMKKFYAACMDENSLKESGLVNIHDLIKALGGWYVLDETGFTFSWENYIERWMQNGIYPDDIFAFYPFRKQNGSVHFEIEMKLPTLSLPAEILSQGEDNKIVQSYFEFMKAVTRYLHPQDKAYEVTLKNILDFEISLAKFIVKSRLNDEINRQITKISYLKETWPEIPWYSIVDGICTFNHVASSFYLEHFNGLGNIVKFMQNAMHSPIVLGNYVIWKAIAKFGVFWNSEIRDIFHKTFPNNAGLFMNGQVDEKCLQSSLESWTCNCIDVTKRTYSTALNYYYQRWTFSTSQQKTIESIADRLKNYFIEKIKIFNDEAGNNHDLLESIKQIKYCIGFHEDISSFSAVKAYYKDAPEIKDLGDPSHLVEWYKRINAYNLRSSNAYKCRDGITDEWLRCKTLINMAQNYDPIPTEIMVKEKTIFISPRLIRGMGMTFNLPPNMDFGRIGFYLARLFASFVFQVDGEYVQLRNREGEIIMLKNDACVKKEIATVAAQFDDKEISYVFLNSTATVDTILDDIAFTALFDVYKKTEQQHFVLPRFEEYQPRNLIWISFGTWMCSRKHQVMNRIRVLMAARKHKEFADNFQCLTNTNMNPENRCPDVWALLTQKKARKAINIKNPVVSKKRLVNVN